MAAWAVRGGTPARLRCVPKVWRGGVEVNGPAALVSFGDPGSGEVELADPYEPDALAEAAYGHYEKSCPEITDDRPGWGRRATPTWTSFGHWRARGKHDGHEVARQAGSLREGCSHSGCVAVCHGRRARVVEGDKGTAELAADYWIRVTTSDGTQSRRYAPVCYPWANPDHRAVEASIVTCHAHLLRALRGEEVAETTGEDNLKTLKLVYACYESARSGEAVLLG